MQTIDSGAFGTVFKCIDHKDPQKRVVAGKICKNKIDQVQNANVEIKILHKLMEGHFSDNEGHDRMVKMIDSFKFRQHIIIVFGCLSSNLYTYM